MPASLLPARQCPGPGSSPSHGGKVFWCRGMGALVESCGGAGHGGRIQFAVQVMREGVQTPPLPSGPGGPLPVLQVDLQDPVPDGDGTRSGRGAPRRGPRTPHSNDTPAGCPAAGRRSPHERGGRVALADRPGGDRTGGPLGGDRPPPAADGSTPRERSLRFRISDIALDNTGRGHYPGDSRSHVGAAGRGHKETTSW